MPWDRKWRRYLRLFGTDVGSDVQDELRFHLEARTAELMAQGRSLEQARSDARRHFGDIREISELCVRMGQEHSRKRRRLEGVAEWWYDIRHSIRSLRRAPWFTATAVVTLAAGLGGAIALFSLVDSWIIHGVQFSEPEQLVYARSLDTRRGREISVSFRDYVDLRERATGLESLSAWSYDSYTLSLHDGVERIAGAKVSTGFFSMLRVTPLFGRSFLPSEEDIGQSKVCIVSYGFWKTRLGGRESAIGSTLNLEGEPYTVVGVLPERFHFTLMGRANIWTPLAPGPEDRSRRQARFLQLVGRMRPGVAVAQVQQELKAIAAQLSASYPDSNLDVGATCTSLSREIGRHTGDQAILVIFGVSIGLLLIAASNVSSLLLVRSLGRKREAAIQLSIGAGRPRLVRQALVETLLIFTAAAITGTLGASWFLGTLTRLIPFDNRGFLPNYGEASIDWRVCAFALAITLLTALGFGLAPAFENARANLVTVLKESGSAISHGRKAKRLRLALVVAQVMLATILLSSTMILVAGSHKIWSAPMGFNSSGVLTFVLALDEHRYPDNTRRHAFFDGVAEALRAPGRPATVARFIPFGGNRGRVLFRVTNQQLADPRRLPSAGFNAVGPEFFSVFQTPLVAGRAFDRRDSVDALPVAMVNNAFAAQYFPGRNAIGQTLWLNRMKGRTVEIIGVFAEMREGADVQGGYPQVFVPFAQDPSSGAYFAVRPENGSDARANPHGLLPLIRSKIAALDSALPVFDAKTLDDRLNEALTPYRNISGMLVWFGVLALVVSTIGVYGVLVFSVSQQTREIGIRAALGATRGMLLAMVFRQGGAILATGLLPGLAGSISSGLALRSVFTDIVQQNVFPPILVTAAVVSGAVLLAILVPARKAASVDPLVALRYE